MKVHTYNFVISFLFRQVSFIIWDQYVFQIVPLYTTSQFPFDLAKRPSAFATNRYFKFCLCIIGCKKYIRMQARKWIKYSQLQVRNDKWLSMTRETVKLRTYAQWRQPQVIESIAKIQFQEHASSDNAFILRLSPSWFRTNESKCLAHPSQSHG